MQPAIIRSNLQHYHGATLTMKLPMKRTIKISTTGYVFLTGLVLVIFPFIIIPGLHASGSGAPGGDYYTDSLYTIIIGFVGAIMVLLSSIRAILKWLYSLI